MIINCINHFGLNIQFLKKSNFFVKACPKSIQFADKIGLDYVSCSPFRIPIARLAAAQAVVLNKKA